MLNRTCREFIDVLASREPVPGGGGASALAGAVGIALGAMVGDTLGQLPAINERLAVAVKAEREKGIGMVKSVLDRVREGK